ncbi:MAG: DUF493 domain-containing protein [Helicobacteraceae bacterium]|jgi:putative lipoic acid-binding regulatory protein|nr:DUF493 domain-containing protein [Helicobacteraceae bacterium]
MEDSTKKNIRAVNNKPDISYPCEWSYHLIGRDESAIKEAVKQTISDKDYALDNSRQSSKGSFVSMKLIVIVADENERLNLFDSLRLRKAILRIL